MPVLSENKCVSTQFELSIRCIEAERERFPKEYICTKMLNTTAPFCHIEFTEIQILFVIVKMKQRIFRKFAVFLGHAQSAVH